MNWNKRNILKYQLESFVSIMLRIKNIVYYFIQWKPNDDFYNYKLMGFSSHTTNSSI